MDDSPRADITRDSVHISTDPPDTPCLETPLEQRDMFDSVSLVISQGSVEGEMSLMDNLSGSICHYYALPPKPSEHSTDKKTEQLDPGEPLEDHLLSVRKSTVGRTHSLPNDSYMFLALHPLGLAAEQAQGAQHTEEGPRRTHSGSSSSLRSQPEACCSQQLSVPAGLFRPISPHGHAHPESIPRLPPPRRSHTLNRTLRRQAAVVSTDSQEALMCSGGEESNEGLLNAASLGLPPLSSSSSSSSSPTSPGGGGGALHQHPALRLVPATPGASPKPPCPDSSSVHTHQPQHRCISHASSSSSSSSSSASPPPLTPARSHRQEEPSSADQEVSLITGAATALASGDVEEAGSVVGVGGDPRQGRVQQGPFLRQLKRFHSADTTQQQQGRNNALLLLPRPPPPRPSSWLDDPRRHSVEVCPSSFSSSSNSSTTTTASSASSGFVSRADSLQTQSQTTSPPPPPATSLSSCSPRRKKKMSPPCISVDPPDGLEGHHHHHPALHGGGSVGSIGLMMGGLGRVSPQQGPLPGGGTRDTCLRRRAPSSSDSKDSFDLGPAGEAAAVVGPDGGSPSPNTNTNPKLLTLPSFSFEKTSSEH